MATRTHSTRSSKVRSSTKKKKKKKPARRTSRLAPVRHALAGHEADFAGLLLFALALVGALAIWLNLAGAIAEGVRIGVGTSVGVAEAVVPLLLGAAGGLLIRDRPLGDRTRLAIGGGLGAGAVPGVGHVGAGRSSSTWPTRSAPPNSSPSTSGRAPTRAHGSSHRETSCSSQKATRSTAP